MRALWFLDARNPRVMSGLWRGTAAAALLLWAAALGALILVVQEVTYRVCDQSLIRFPPPAIHWPPQGQHLELLTAQHELTLTAVGFSIIASFLTLYASPHIGVARRTVYLLASVAGSCLLGVVLWLIDESHVLHAHVDALAQCL